MKLLIDVEEENYNHIKNATAEVVPIGWPAIKHGIPYPDKWILATDELPKERDWYLGIFREPDTGWINPIPYVCDYVGKETIGTTKAGWILKNITDEQHCTDYYRNLECVYWQPLPVKPNIPDLNGGDEE